jgi:hypothetical protein
MNIVILLVSFNKKIGKHIYLRVNKVKIKNYNINIRTLASKNQFYNNNNYKKSI